MISGSATNSPLTDTSRFTEGIVKAPSELRLMTKERFKSDHFRWGL